MSRITTNYSSLLHQTLPYLPKGSRVLDLACGTGRNGCYLASLGYQVTYLDKNESSLASIQHQDDNATLLLADLETTPPYQLTPHAYDTIIVFRYLHRRLMPSIINAIKPGGLIVYETFTHQQASIGRPKNPDFLLNTNELAMIYNDFIPLIVFEGYCEEQQAYISQFVGRKPANTI